MEIIPSLSNDQKYLIKLLNKFMLSGFKTLFISRTVYFGLNFVFLIFIKNLKENVNIFTYTQRQANVLYGDYMNIIKSCNNQLLLHDSKNHIIKYMDQNQNTRHIEFISSKNRSYQTENTLNIYTEQLYNEFKMDSNRFISKTIWVINSEISNKELKELNGILIKI